MNSEDKAVEKETFEEKETVYTEETEDGDSNGEESNSEGQ